MALIIVNRCDDLERSDLTLLEGHAKIKEWSKWKWKVLMKDLETPRSDHTLIDCLRPPYDSPVPEARVSIHVQRRKHITTPRATGDLGVSIVVSGRRAPDMNAWLRMPEPPAILRA
ncbi:hypothetical protein DOTSEDRAFT_38110 [Dothistroma septosporum NZE10]|uniref:Uncharacterized protein n=1 Tax=Dothistroma septosporum (strain NZE10 / CBS 128990) TaxID=675120 RepID=N1PCC4_DOTSN|nr:hypothetical protein DOTSEDRAFT_38110 [Dothistroma septosporum NZE10]